MPGIRSILVAAGILAGVALYFHLWFHWPLFLAVGVAAVVALASLLVTAALGRDPAAEDAAWREAAPDLVRRRLGPDDDGRPGRAR